MLLNKEALLGIYASSKKNIEFNISWNTGTRTITAYNPPVNENDRPRINTWRSDDTNVIYMSAGHILYNPTTFQNFTLWGNRSIGTAKINISLWGSLSAGIDFFTDDRFPAPTLFPTTGWSIYSTPNPNERKYQYTITKAASSILSFGIVIN